MSMNQKLNKSKLLNTFWIKEIHLLYCLSQIYDYALSTKLKPVASKLSLA